MKPHIFNELVNDIREIATYMMGYDRTEEMHYWLTRHSLLHDIPEKEIYAITNVCKEFYKTQQLRAHIVKVLGKIGIVPDHEHERRRLEVAQAGFDMAVSLKNKREQGPGPCLA